MDCYAWKIPEGCYATALYGDGQCRANWWWIAAVIAAGLLLLGGNKKKAPARRVRAKRK